jgi:hypothetical protein
LVTTLPALSFIGSDSKKRATAGEAAAPKKRRQLFGGRGGADDSTCLTLLGLRRSRLSSLIDGLKSLGGDRKGIGFPLLKLAPDRSMKPQRNVRLLDLPNGGNLVPSDAIGRAVQLNISRSCSFRPSRRCSLRLWRSYFLRISRSHRPSTFTVRKRGCFASGFTIAWPFLLSVASFRVANSDDSSVPASKQSRDNQPATGNQSDLGNLFAVFTSGGKPMLKKLALAMATVGLLMSTASADYYIVQEKATKKCKVVETRPTETTWIQIGPAAFKTQADAEKQIKTVCVEKR